jgi:hypothetical protein
LKPTGRPTEGPPPPRAANVTLDEARLIHDTVRKRADIQLRIELTAVGVWERSQRAEVDAKWPEDGSEYEKRVRTGRLGDITKKATRRRFEAYNRHTREMDPVLAMLVQVRSPRAPWDATAPLDRTAEAVGGAEKTPSELALERRRALFGSPRVG